MFNLFKRQNAKGEEMLLKISNMHCASCAMSIDDTLEDLEGVSRSRTNYAQSITKISFDKEKIGYTKIKETIESLGYTVDNTHNT